jgi:hypothetical protein
MSDSSVPDSLVIRHNDSESRFETVVSGLRSVAEYHLRDDRMVITHTLVPSPLRGRGIAGALVRHVLLYARQYGLKVVPECSYVSHYMTKHPEFNDLKTP